MRIRFMVLINFQPIFMCVYYVTLDSLIDREYTISYGRPKMQECFIHIRYAK